MRYASSAMAKTLRVLVLLPGCFVLMESRVELLGSGVVVRVENVASFVLARSIIALHKGDKGRVTRHKVGTSSRDSR